ncbi:MAG TPA: amino acid permease [Vicinamibacterales bacterium]|nr:amino acid permease [Vicinamibacterales bacterium]
MSQLFRMKSMDRMLEDVERGKTRLKRTLGPFQLTILGIGAIVGAGIFSTIGTAAAGGAGHIGAGPAIILSFALTAVACGFAALCYAEFAAMVPISGSAYTYAYATLGELIAWIIGWDLIIEYAVGNVAVAISWSGYFQELLRNLGIGFPAWMGTDYRSAAEAVREVAAAAAAGIDPSTLGPAITLAAQALADAPRLAGIPIVFNLPAFTIVMLITWVLVIGIKESAWVTTGTTFLNISIILFFVIVGALYVRPENWTPFAPNGVKGVWGAAAIIFFAYIGFDAVSTAAEETRNPQRDMPIGMIASLVICTVIYIAVAIVLTGLLNWQQLGTAQPLATAFSAIGMNWAAGVISLGAIFATTSVLIVFQLGQPRIFFSMARDGLLPSWAAKVHPKYQTPHVTTILTGVAVAVFASFTNINEVVELTNIGTLFAFVLVAMGILVLRHVDPQRHRPFRTPLVPLVPLLAMASCTWLMLQLPARTWWRFGLWLAAGLVVYFIYGYRHSRLRQDT